MMTSPNTMIMIANMNTAATVEAIFSIVASAFNIPSSKIHLPKVSILHSAANRVLRLFGGNGRYRRVEFPERVAAALAASVQSLRPGFGDALHQILELRVDLRRERIKTNALGFERLLGLVVRLLHRLAGGRNDLVGDVDHRLLDFRRQLLPGAVADRIGNDKTAEAEPVGGIFDELVGAIGNHALERKQQPVHGAARQRFI